ncbi:TPA: hypothetical protein RTG10_001841 [Campylobacter jejuni]|nr:hypothetical protein [Campylobacter jejuni]
MKDDKTLLPQKSQFGDKFWLMRDDLAVCENGRIFDYDDLGKLIKTQYECILNNISKASCKKTSKYNRFKKYHH